MQIAELYNLYLKHPSVQIDSRKLKPGDIFFALKGPNFNANDFAVEAINNGAAYSVVDELPESEDNRIIKVDDVLKTLQDLALHHRNLLNESASGKAIPFIAITGSNGKTTSKELVHAVLSESYKTYTTEGNLNNHIGIPITILKIKADVEVAIIEMGANHQKEIEEYCVYTRPTHGVITNCGKAHLEGFGSEEGIRKGKGELFDYIKEHNGTAFVMWDYNYLQTMSSGINNVIKYGTGNADINGSVKNNSGLLEISIHDSDLLGSIKTNLVGEYNLPNILLAVSIGKYFDVSEKKIKSALENYQPSNARSQLIEKNGNKIILDAYNANPTSMKAAVENFSKMDGDDKVLLLGSMKELGDDTFQEHQVLVNLIKKYKWKNVVLVGNEFKNLANEFIYFENSELARDWFVNQQFSNSQFLVKGSRSTKMERIME